MRKSLSLFYMFSFSTIELNAPLHKIATTEEETQMNEMKERRFPIYIIVSVRCDSDNLRLEICFSPPAGNNRQRIPRLSIREFHLMDFPY